MIELDKLYADVEPTKQRSINEKFRPAATTPFWLWVADRFFYGMLENRFYAFRYKGVENVLERNQEYPTIMYAPHSNWWDGLVGYNICNRIFKKEIRLMVEELNRFPLLRRGGAFSVNKKSPQASMAALAYAIDELADSNNFLYLFPQGIINPPNYRPIKFQTGLAYMAQKAVKKYGGVNLQPIAVNYFSLRDNRPEVMVEFGKTIFLNDDKVDRKEFTNFLSQNLEELCDSQFDDIRHARFAGYRTLFQQRLKWYRRIEQRLKGAGLPKSGV